MALVLTGAAVFAGLLLTSTGLFLWVEGGTEAAVQLSQVTHVGLGWLLLAPMIWATLRHRKLRGTNPTGLLNLLSLVISVISGVAQSVVALIGAAPVPGLLAVHAWSSVALLGTVMAHLFIAQRRRPAARWVGRWAAPGGIATAIAVGAIFALGAWLDGVRAAPGVDHEAYEMPFGDSPFSPANATLVGESTFVHPSRLGGSLGCRSCHADIYEQWSQSMHRFAATDPHVETGIRWFQRDNGVAAGRFCAGCHNPIGLLAGDFDASSTPLDEGTPPHPEGVSCLSCHAIVAVGEDPLGNGSYQLRPPMPPLLGAGWLGDALLRLDPADHSAAMMQRPLFQDPKLCGSCHQQYVPVALGGDGPGAPENQFPEWADSPYADPANPDRKTCNECHMPLVPGVDPASIDGMIHSHRFVGANHAHAVASGHDVQAAETLAFLRENVTLRLAVAAQQTRPGHLTVEATITNVGAGHSFPSGTTDISETWIELVAGDPGAPLLASGLLDDAHYLDPGAHQWRKVMVDSANVPVDLHNLATVAGVTVDDYIAPGKSDTARYDVPLRDVAERTTTLPVRARLRMRKANQRWNDWLSNFDGSTVPVTDIHTERLEVDLATVTVPAAAPEPPGEPAATPESVPPVSGMVFVPGGPALIGSDDGDPDEAPARTVEVPGFYIDRFTVTNSAYRRFLRKTGGPGPVHQLGWASAYNWTGQDFPEGTADRAAVLINHEEADAYCRWLGKRLPREVEWEKAARGPAGRRYPWGERWEDGLCPAVDGQVVPARVGMCPSRASPYGAHEMVGGVFEWVADSYRAYDRTFLHPNANEWITTFGDPSYVLRGVPAGHVGPATTAASRAGHADNMRAKIGFRCAQDAP